MLEYTGGRISGAVLRLIQPADSVSELTDLLHRAYASLAQSGFRFHAAWQDEDVTRRRIASGECWVAELAGQIIGTATLRPLGRASGTPWYERTDVAVVGQFAVDPAFQGSGLGTALLKHLEARAQTLGAMHLAMDTAEGATRLIRYYGRLGYGFVEHVQWDITNYRSVVLSKALAPELPIGAPAVAPPDDRLAAKLRGFGPVGVLAMVVIVALGPVLEPLGALLALAWAHRSRTPWREIGFIRPKSWIRTLAVGIVFGSSFKILMKMIVMPLLGADPTNQAYHYLVGNRAALPEMFFDVIVGAGFGEETVFRGFLFERLGKLFGRGVGATTAIVLLTSAWFGLIHYPVQGLAGAEQAAVTGLVFGTIFARTGRIWMLVFAHAAFDVTAVLMIYWNLESYVAHLIFK